MSDIIYITEEGLQKLKEELDQLRLVERPMISKLIADARDKGDLTENAEYAAAKEAQGMVEMKIARIDDIIARSRVIDESKIDTSTVRILNKVKIKNRTNNSVMEYQIVPESEANFKLGKIAISRPWPTPRTTSPGRLRSRSRRACSPRSPSPRPLRLGVTARFRFRKQEPLENAKNGSELQFGAGLWAPLYTSPRAAITGHAELFGATSLASFGSREESPIELLLGAKSRLRSGLTIGIGAGPGLQRGIGSPDYRLLATLGWAMAAPQAKPTTAARPDACPAVAEAPNAPEDKGGVEDTAGAPDPEAPRRKS